MRMSLMYDAKRGHLKSQYDLATMYLTGEGMPQDDKEAAKWYNKAAESGYAPAQCNLGNMCSVGRGVPRDYKKAAEWHMKAARQGNPVAQCNLAKAYAMGRGVPQDLVEAYKWVCLAAAQGHKDAIQGKKLLEEEMPPAQISKARKMVEKLAITSMN